MLGTCHLRCGPRQCSSQGTVTSTVTSPLPLRKPAFFFSSALQVVSRGACGMPALLPAGFQHCLSRETRASNLQPQIAAEPGHLSPRPGSGIYIKLCAGLKYPLGNLCLYACD